MLIYEGFVMKKYIFPIILLLLLSTNVFANSAAPYRLPDQSSIYFDSDSGVMLYHEIIKITLSDYLSRAGYKVVYEFKNILDEDIELPIWFITDGYNEYSFNVWIDSKNKNT